MKILSCSAFGSWNDAKLEFGAWLNMVLPICVKQSNNSSNNKDENKKL